MWKSDKVTRVGRTGDPTPALQHLALLEEVHLRRREAVLQLGRLQIKKSFKNILFSGYHTFIILVVVGGASTDIHFVSLKCCPLQRRCSMDRNYRHCAS